jgi:hypothetical protein
MTRRLWASIPAIALSLSLTAIRPTSLFAQAATSDSAEFAAWRQVQKEDIDGMRAKFMSLAKVVPASKLSWHPMEGTKSFHEVFAHIAAEGNTETAMFGRPLPSGSLADFDAEEARLSKLSDEQVILAMDQAMHSLSTTMSAISLATIKTPVRYYGQMTLPRVAVAYTVNDLHEHLGQLVAYARANQIVPPWSKKN